MSLQGSPPLVCVVYVCVPVRACVCVCVLTCMCARAYLHQHEQEVGGQLVGVGLSFQHLGPRDQIQVIKFGAGIATC